MAVVLTGYNGSRKQIDSFFNDYEKFVEKVEKTAKEKKMSSLTSLETEAVKFAEKSDKFRNMSDWNIDDSEKLLKLTSRYTDAILKLSGATDSSSDGLFDSLLNGLF